MTPGGLRIATDYDCCLVHKRHVISGICYQVSIPLNWKGEKPSPKQMLTLPSYSFLYFISLYVQKQGKKEKRKKIQLKIQSSQMIVGEMC